MIDRKEGFCKHKITLVQKEVNWEIWGSEIKALKGTANKFEVKLTVIFSQIL